MKSRSGSALLVVLGMLAFMVISGVAFSVFMRSSRLPAAFTRRASSTRQLAKAALAEAIEQIDRSIGNDPHPNVRQNGSDKYNYWLGRVFLSPYQYIDDNGDEDTEWPDVIRQNILADMNNTGTSQSSTYDPNTVPVLTLEALAYLPPPLVNEARYFGQKTPTACWQTFDFDAGRYAYVALDVSDYFDLNRLVADEPRSSNPARRVTLGHLFESGDASNPHSSAPSGTDKWESFMDTFRDINDDDGTFNFNSKIPLLSLADFNLAVRDQKYGNIRSPFYDYILGNSKNEFYGTTSARDLAKIGEMTFVADSLEAPTPEAEKKTEAGETVLDLDDDDNQIFTSEFLDAAQDTRPLIKISTLSSVAFSRLVQKRVPTVTMFNLSDYLDADRIPISLGIPSVERVPMICGIKPTIGSSKVKVAMEIKPIQAIPTAAPANGAPTTATAEYEYHWRLDAQALAAGFMGGTVQAIVVYPFLNHERAEESGNFQLDGKVQLFLSSETMRLRTGSADGLLHWTASGTETSAGNAGLMDKSVVNLPFTARNIDLQQGLADPSKCAQSVTLNLSGSASKIASELANEKGDILTAKYQWTVTWDSSSGKWEPNYPDQGEVPPATAVQSASSALRPLKGDGTVDSDFSDDMKQEVATLDKTLLLNMAVTLRVTSSDRSVLGGASGTKTVDMVPATLYDDKPLNGIDNSMGLAAGIFKDLTGRPTPLMKFETGISFPCKFDKTAICDADVKLSVAGGKAASVMVDDPRYNHAPENWKVLDDFTAAGWLAATTAATRDGDIFMATSDQNYLQNGSEFAFLPRFSDLFQYKHAVRGSLSGYPAPSDSWENLCEQDPIDRDLMWKTYDLQGRYSDDGDDFDGLGLGNLGKGQRVNPYSDSTNVLMAAFANTPHDWRAASENEDVKQDQGFDTSASAFYGKHAWNAYSSGAKLAWEDLELVAGGLMEEVQEIGDGRWDEALHNLFKPKSIRERTELDDTEDYLCGVQLESPSDKIYSVDKKFLYGYWKSCFAARQQLFLIFFRAEPMMLGGGIASATPPQLGARGVALVWRNPNNPKNSAAGTKGYAGAQGDPFAINRGYTPHQTRVLFYKQFE